MSSQLVLLFWRGVENFTCLDYASGKDESLTHQLAFLDRWLQTAHGMVISFSSLKSLKQRELT